MLKGGPVKKSLISFSCLALAVLSSLAASPRHALEHGGVTREYLLDLPDAKPTAVVVLLYGYGSRAEGYCPQMVEAFRARGWATCRPEALPDGNGKRSWNVGYPSQKTMTNDETSFMTALVAKLKKDLGVSRAYLTGMSNGGEMCYQMAYRAPKTFDAIASMAGLTLTCLSDAGEPQGGVAFMEVHGTLDKTSLWEGDVLNKNVYWGGYLSVTDAVMRIVRANGGDGAFRSERIAAPLAKAAERPVTLHTYSGTFETRLYEIENGGHSWAFESLDVQKVVCDFFAASVPASGGGMRKGAVTSVRNDPGTVMAYTCWASDGLRDGEGALYFFLEFDPDTGVRALESLMRRGAVPPGIAVFTNPGTMPAPAGSGGADRWMRAAEYDQPGTAFPSLLIEDVLPAVEKTLGVTASRSPDLHFITGASSGGIAAWNACWYRNDFFRRCYCNSPTFSNIRQGVQLMPLVRKCETRPIRVWLSAGTDEPDYHFGDSYFVAADAAGALRFAGYEVRYDLFPHEDHGTHWCDGAYTERVLAWLFEDWKTKPVAVATHPLRVRDVLVKGSVWEACDFAMPPPCTEVVSVDGWRAYAVSPTNRFVLSSRANADGSRDQTYRLAPLEMPWNVSLPGGRALAQAADGRLYVATELGVQGVVPFGIMDVVLPLPGDAPCDNVALVGDVLYASSGARTWKRRVKTGAADPAKKTAPSAPGYADGFWYARDHVPAGGVRDLFGSYVVGGRVAGVLSGLADPSGQETFDAEGWTLYGARRRDKFAPDTLCAIFSMTKTFTGAALMCAIDAGKLSLDDPASKYLPEFADVKMLDGSKPNRPVTIRDLTSHVSGFRGGPAFVNRDVPVREAARLLAKEPLHTQPGAAFCYGTATFDAAAACLEVATGVPYERYLKEKILDPLGLVDTTFTPSEAQLKRLAHAYNSDDTTIRPAADDAARQLVFPKAKPLFPAAGAGLFSTPRDALRFAEMLAHHGTWNGRTIISRKTFDEIFAVKQTPDGVAERYACGAWLDGDWLGHEGAMRTDFRANLKTGHARAFFIQTENAAGSAFFQLKRDWLYEADKFQGLLR